jgi:hypothetical protein
MTDPAPPKTPAGWYPEGVNGMRYWDGDAWTDHRAPATAAPPRAKRTRNYLGDLSVAAVIIAIIAFAIWQVPLVVILTTVVALVLSILGLRTAGQERSRVTSILGLVGAGILALIILVIFAAAALTR